MGYSTTIFVQRKGLKHASKIIPFSLEAIKGACYTIFQKDVIFMKNFFNQILRYQKLLFLLLLIVAATVIFFPIHNFQAPIAQGDHGRDLYAFEQITKGAVPYHNFWWVYGPLTPYLFAFAFKIFGASIQTAIVTQLFFKACAAIFCYLSLACFVSPIFSFIGALWLLTFQPTFPHTYTHAAGVAASVAMVYFLFSYLRSFGKKYLFFGLATGFLLSFMKLNFGIANLTAFSVCFLLISYFYPPSQKIKNNASEDVASKQATSLPGRLQETRLHQKTYFIALFSSLFFIVGLYWLLLRGLPFYEIRQCFPLLNADHPYTASAFSTFYTFAKDSVFSLSSTWIRLFFTTIVCSSVADILVQSPKTEDEKKKKLKILLALFFLVIFFIFNLHEFLVSGVHYRMSWAKPFQMMLLFLALAAGLKNLNKIIKIFFFSSVIFIIATNVINQNNIIRHFKQPVYRFKINKTDVFTTNHPLWIMTVHQTTHFLKTQLKKDETFFALPYDPLYYFLTNKESPTRQLIFFDHINIPKEQEISIIAELEKKKVNYVVLSSRCTAQEHGLGTFGKTYCPLLALYILGNFEPIQAFGDWTNEPGWAWNHGTRIFKRKNAL